MSHQDLATAVIDMRRALPEPAAGAAHLGRDPQEGIRLTVPNDDQHWMLLEPVGTAEPGPVHWQLSEVMSRGAHLPTQSTVLASGTAEDVLSQVDAQYRRLLLERRNAACGTPTR